MHLYLFLYLYLYVMTNTPSNIHARSVWTAVGGLWSLIKRLCLAATPLLCLQRQSHTYWSCNAKTMGIKRAPSCWKVLSVLCRLYPVVCSTQLHVWSWSSNLKQSGIKRHFLASFYASFPSIRGPLMIFYPSVNLHSVLKKCHLYPFFKLLSERKVSTFTAIHFNGIEWNTVCADIVPPPPPPPYGIWSLLTLLSSLLRSRNPVVTASHSVEGSRCAVTIQKEVQLLLPYKL